MIVYTDRVLSLPTGAPGETVRLNIGCGPNVVPGWINLDKSPSVALARVPRFRALLGKAGVLSGAQAQGMPPGARHADAARAIPLPTNSVSDVYSSHMIEHMARWQSQAFLAECRRVLVGGGLIRVLTPDLRKMAEDYLDGVITEPWMTPADSFVHGYGAYHALDQGRLRALVHRLTSGSIHQWLYDADSLALLLRDAGFDTVAYRSFREGAMAGLEIIEHRRGGLFVEAW